MSRSVGFLIFAGFLAVACATSSTGRSQLKLFPEPEMAKMGVAAFDKLKSEMKVSSNGTLKKRARCVVDQLAPQVGGEYATMKWEVTVFDDDSPNAFALPGGKIGVHSGLFQVAKNQHQLAAVMGHEIAHVLEGHSNERVSTQYATQSGIALVGVISGGSSPAQQELLSMLGAGAIVLPFSRAQESEADQVGLMLMARAGFDPAESIPLWENMSAAGGGSPPEFLSTHPSHGTRIANLQGWQSEATQLRQQAKARGLSPSCY
jgi:predicted Zn-dependent protease